jgi:hypothetical protein
MVAGGRLQAASEVKSGHFLDARGASGSWMDRAASAGPSLASPRGRGHRIARARARAGGGRARRGACMGGGAAAVAIAWRGGGGGGGGGGADCWVGVPIGWARARRGGGGAIGSIGTQHSTLLCACCECNCVLWC